jgi:DUF1016 N-terminal domain
VASAKAPQAALYGRIREILDAARASVARTVNSTQVVANWPIGREIVEAEQRGRHRADYGTQLLAGLSARLTQDFGRGWSADNLEAFRQFYLHYPRLVAETTGRARPAPRISATASRKSAPPNISETPSRKSMRPGELQSDLSWSHYRALLRVSRQQARDFYEIEAVRNAWSVRELTRQIASLLFDRLAKSRDKAGMMAGQGVRLRWAPRANHR